MTSRQGRQAPVLSEHASPPGEGSVAAPRDGTPAHRHRRWSGWLGFGAVLMTVVGVFSMVEGLVALATPSFFATQGGRVLALSLAGWGWLHLVLGVLMVAAGAALFGGGRSWIGAAAVGVAMVNMFVQLVWLPAFPLWSIVIVGLDLLVLYAIATTWPDRRVRR